MTTYRIEFTDDAKKDLTYFTAFERKAILDQVSAQLGQEPFMLTRNRKVLRENPLAPWVLRIGKYRVFYQVEKRSSRVSIVAIGFKAHNLLYIRGKEIRI
ncbi:MAG: type II toxin-antitoxin system RelE/ParE family toxin [Candidatus Hydrogenedentes bacterium]|nr:type II toxin-antitoxin system RelE/ParE family toxin [Candidatus Hydrogenedentota bacterium]